MGNKVLGAVLLACVICWSLPAITVAALSLGPAHASTAAVAQKHSCCPRIHTQLRPSFLAVPPPSNMPCDSRHPCCLQRGQENAPALLSLRTDSRPDLQLAYIDRSDERAAVLPVTTAPIEVNPSKFCLLQGTVLRN